MVCPKPWRDFVDKTFYQNQILVLIHKPFTVRGEGKEPPGILPLLRQPADPRPKLESEGDGPLRDLTGLRPPWDDWGHVRDRCLDLAARVMEQLTERPEPAPSEGGGPGI